MEREKGRGRMGERTFGREINTEKEGKRVSEKET
jgi:hypothetical protein